jgi:ketosteroid isomerase-like protein
MPSVIHQSARYCAGDVAGERGTVRRAVEGFNRRDIEPMLEVSHPEIEWYPFTAQVERDEPYHGHEGLRQWLANLAAVSDDYEASIDDVREKAGVVIALGHVRGHFKSGITLDLEIAWVVRFRDGLAVWGRAYQSHAKALEAAGLRE